MSAFNLLERGGGGGGGCIWLLSLIIGGWGGGWRWGGGAQFAIELDNGVSQGHQIIVNS